jgi:hypothetical protein
MKLNKLAYIIITFYFFFGICVNSYGQQVTNKDLTGVWYTPSLSGKDSVEIRFIHKDGWDGFSTFYDDSVTFYSYYLHNYKKRQIVTVYKNINRNSIWFQALIRKINTHEIKIQEFTPDSVISWQKENSSNTIYFFKK